MQAGAFALCSRIRSEYGGTGKVLNMSRAAGCFTADVAMEYCFAKTYGYVEAKDFEALFPRALEGMTLNMHLIMHFPWILDFLHMLPDWLVGNLNPGMASIFAFRKVCPLPKFLVLAK
jgi:hypothetical protein